jgi:hypothetical protein
MTVLSVNKLTSNLVHNHLEVAEAAATQSDTNVLSVYQIMLKRESNRLVAAAAGANLFDRDGDGPWGRD